MQEEINISEEKGWLAKTKDIIYENWQTILVALIVLIVGISAYNHNQQNPNENNSAVQQNTEETVDISKEENKDSEEQVEQKDEQQANNDDQNNKEEKEMPAEDKAEKTNQEDEQSVTKKEDGYEIIASKGEGITHMARKAMEEYLKENTDDEITNLHKIYIEDYIQNRTGSQMIEIGHKENFSKKLIAEAVASSKELSAKSLDNLKKYSTK